MSQILGVYLKFCEFEGRIYVGRVHSQDTHQQLCLGIPPSTNHCVCKGQWCWTCPWDANCEICAVGTSLLLSTGVLQTQVGNIQKKSKHGKGHFSVRWY